MSADPLVTRLAAIVGGPHVLTDPDVMDAFQVDWTRRWSGQARCVVRPADAGEVSAVLAECHAAGAPVVPQGGNTGLVGGSVPVGVPGAVVLSLRRLDLLGPVDELTGQLTVGAGATVAAVQRHARAAGWELGLDLAARDSATIGGAVATNAGGERVLRYGTTRAQVVALDAVRADGRPFTHIGSDAARQHAGSATDARSDVACQDAGSRIADGVVKESVGYDLAGLLVGSEGTLAVITAIRLRLAPLLPARATALLGVADTAAAQRVLSELRRRVDGVEAAELFHADGLDLVRQHTGLPAPLPSQHSTFLLVECAGRADPSETLAAALAGLSDVQDAAIAVDAPAQARLWRYREAHTEAINAAGVPVKLDVAVPPAVLPDVELELRRAVRRAAPGARIILFGHLAEANIHVNVLGAVEDAERVTDIVLRLVAAHGGSISAEHGVGRAKARWLHLSRTPWQIAAMRAIKEALDPASLLNPGALLP